MGKNVTLRDIAQQIGVSTVTVSKALNDKEGVSDELKEKIKELADELGYRSNASARAMKEGITRNVGVIVPKRFVTESQAFYLKFYQQICTELDSHEYSGILHVLSAEDEEQLMLPRIYFDRKVDGFLVLGQIVNEYIAVLNDIDVPVVYVDFYNEEAMADTIISDSFYGMYEMTNYLIKNGHRQLAFVGNIYSTSSIQDRFLGFYKSILEHRIPFGQESIVNDRDDRGNLIDMRLPEPLPTAFVCNCDVVAYRLIKQLNQLGCRVPDDCSVVGFDNDIYSEISEPKLTTIEVDTEEMSKAAVKLLFSKLDQPSDKWNRLSVKGTIIYRDSVRAIGKAPAQPT